MRKPLTVGTVALATSLVMAAEKPAVPAWVERSNQNTRIVLQSEAEFAPEFYARQGVEGFDDKIVDLKPGIFERTRAVERKLLADWNRG